MVPVNEVTSEGLPHLLIRDLPPVSDPGAPAITEPRIYFGERPSDYVIVGARQPEFDYPASGTAGSGGAIRTTRTSWTARPASSLDSTLTRLLFALRFRDLNLLISDQITSDSQLLMHRSLHDRWPRVAPFLRFDHDPYLVVDAAGRCSTSRTPTPPATASRTPRPPTRPAARPQRPRGRRPSTTSATASRS